MKMKALLGIFSLLMVSQILSSNVEANESMKQKAEEVYNDSKRELGKAGRAVKDEACRMMNGKMECAADKAKHKAQDVSDNVKDAID